MRQRYESNIEETAPLYSTPDNLTETQRRCFSLLSYRKLNRAIRKKKWIGRLDWFFSKVEATVWILGAFYVITQSNFFHIIFIHPMVNK